MKIYNIIFVLLLIIFMSCSKTTEPVDNEESEMGNEIRIEVLKRIFDLEEHVNWRIQELRHFKSTGENLLSWYTAEEFIEKLKNEENDIGFIRAGTLRLAKCYLNEADNLLIDFLENSDDSIVRLNSARSLAYRGKDNGSEILLNCASGDLIISSSDFERNAAALALLLLEKELPKEYLEWPFADPLFLMLAE
jgi:hypothetical protein